MHVGPSLLIASPRMKDPFFERTVVLVWHHDEDGAIGVVVNRGLSPMVHDLLDLDEGLEPYDEARVGWGGPVEPTSGTVLTRGTVHEDEGWALPTGIGVTRSQDALVRLLREHAELVLCLGYAGWGPGQLDKEIADGSWIFTECDADIVFDRDVELRYARALASLGLDENTVWMPPIEE